MVILVESAVVMLEWITQQDPTVQVAIYGIIGTILVKFVDYFFRIIRSKSGGMAEHFKILTKAEQEFRADLIAQLAAKSSEIERIKKLHEECEEKYNALHTEFQGLKAYVETEVAGIMMRRQQSIGVPRYGHQPPRSKPLRSPD